MQLTDVEGALRRPNQYFFEDGLWEIAVGLWLTLTVAIPLLVGGWLGEQASLLVLGTSLVVQPAVVAAKERWVFPRTGHVTYPSPAPEPRVSLGLGAAAEPAPDLDRRERALRLLTPLLAAATLAIVIPLLQRGARDASLPPGAHLDSGAAVFHLVVGLLLGGFLLYSARRFRQRRWVAVGVALALSGLGVGLLASAREQALSWHVSFMTGALLSSGVAAFVSYRRRTVEVPDSDGR